MTYNQTISAAIDDLATHGYTEERLSYWQRQIRVAAETSFRSMAQMEADLKEALAAVYKRQVEQGGAVKFHPGVGRFTFDRLKPDLRVALERRQTASRNLIRLNRAQAILREEQRLAGWASSIPPGGTDQVKKRKLKAEIRKPLASLPFEERRVIIDQSHKLAANINATIAEAGGAIAVIWHDHGAIQVGYDARPNHMARDGKVFLLKASWARGAGLVKPGDAGYYEDITAFAEEINCRCYGTWLYGLGQLPANMLTQKGAQALADAKAKIREMA